jgi:hypothetical protein
MIFRRKRQSTAQDDTRLSLFEKPKDLEEALPLYEGLLSNRYDHRARTYAGYAGPNKYGTAPGALETTDEDKTHPDFEIEPRYWMNSVSANPRLQLLDNLIPVAFRDVGAAWRNKRTTRAAILPKRPATNKLPMLAVSSERAFEFLAIFNSSVCDFLVRGHMPGASANMWIVSQVAVPLPGVVDPRVAEHAAKLSLTSHSVARLFGRAPHRWDPAERAALDVEIDALVAHAYGLTRAQYEVVLDSFEVLARVETAKHGHYQFKSACLAAYERVG